MPEILGLFSVSKNLAVANKQTWEVGVFLHWVRVQLVVLAEIYGGRRIEGGRQFQFHELIHLTHRSPSSVECRPYCR